MLPKHRHTDDRYGHADWAGMTTAPRSDDHAPH